MGAAAIRIHFAGLSSDALGEAPLCGQRAGRCVDELRRVTCLRCRARFGRASLLAWRLTVIRLYDEPERELRRLLGSEASG